jgi:hypothetical protein
MVQTTEDRARRNGAERFNDAMERGVFGQGSVGSQFVVIACIRVQDPAQVRFAQDHDMIQALSP